MKASATGGSTKRPKLPWSLALASTISLMAASCGSPSGATPTSIGGVGGGDDTGAQAAADSEAAVAEASETSGALDADEIPITDVCSLVSAEEAAAVLGAAPLDIASGEEPDEVTGGTLRFCTYLGPGVALVLSVVEVESADLATQAAVRRMQEDESDAQQFSETGLGDAATWVVVSQAAGYVVTVANEVFSISLGGPALGDPTSHKAALRMLSEVVAGRL